MNIITYFGGGFYDNVGAYVGGHEKESHLWRW